MTYHTNGSCALKSITVEWEYFLVRKDKETLIFRKKKKKNMLLIVIPGLRLKVICFMIENLLSPE